MYPGSVNVIYVTLRGFARPSHFFQPLEAVSPTARQRGQRFQKPIEVNLYTKANPKANPPHPSKYLTEGRNAAKA
jgi:hypothetical protein